MSSKKNTVNKFELTGPGKLSVDGYPKKCISFLNEIGIETKFEKFYESCFLPGLSIHGGVILLDTGLLKYPGVERLTYSSYNFFTRCSDNDKNLIIYL